MSALSDFTQKWCDPNHLPRPVTDADFAAAESALGVRFPDDYRTQLINVGLPSPTLALLGAILEQDLDLHDLSDLTNPKIIQSDAVAWQKGGMPTHLLPIGGDSMGNQFCFDIADLKTAPDRQAPIYFWDHDFYDTEEMAASFSDWINMYLGKWSSGLSYADS